MSGPKVLSLYDVLCSLAVFEIPEAERLPVEVEQISKSPPFYPNLHLLFVPNLTFPSDGHTCDELFA